MNANEFLGALVISLGALFGLMATLSKFVSQPINRLNESVIKLTAKLDNTDDNVARLDRRVDRHGQRLDDHDQILARNNLK